MPTPLSRAMAAAQAVVDAAAKTVTGTIKAPPPIPKHMEGLAAAKPRTMMDTTDTGWVNPVPDANITHRQAVSRWYDNIPGGYDAAVASSQDAMAASGSPWGRYGRWKPEDVDTPIEVFTTDNKLLRNSLGEHGPLPMHQGTPARHAEVRVRSEVLGQPVGPAVLEHELTHGLTNGDWQRISARNFDIGFDTPDVPPGHFMEGIHAKDPGIPDIRTLVSKAYQRGDANDFEAALPASQKSTIDKASYVLEPVEADARLAEVRRRFAWHTGRDVKTPEDAQEALSWFMRNGAELMADQPTTYDQFANNIYKHSGDDYRKKLLQRMPQVLSIGGAATMPFALQGLRETDNK